MNKSQKIVLTTGLGLSMVFVVFAVAIRGWPLYSGDIALTTGYEFTFVNYLLLGVALFLAVATLVIVMFLRVRHD
jgi:hypothetical protein